MSSSNTTYLITGSSRGETSICRPTPHSQVSGKPASWHPGNWPGYYLGIGKGLLASYLLRPKTTVIAAVRNPESDGSKSLGDLPKGEDSQLIIVKIDSASETDAATAVKDLKSTHNIQKLDVVIANAGHGTAYDQATNLRIADLQATILVNAIGPILLFQAVLPLLKQSSKPIFIVISSNAGSIGGMRDIEKLDVVTYGSSKAMINYVVRKIHFEHKDIISLPLHPG